MRIHIIEDDDALRTALARLLGACGYRVDVHASAEAFLRAGTGGEAGCILLDVDMPGLGGLELQDRLRASGSILPIVFLTGNGSIAMSVRAIKAGAEDFLSKPVGKEALLDAIGRAMRRYETAAARDSLLSDLRGRAAMLTAREREVFALVVRGLLNKQIAFELGNTERTVKAHRRSLMEKLGAGSLAELVQMANRLGVSDPGHGAVQ
ncbi:response regulator transcription factor [Pseudoduganella namucuonensis]|uniref:Two component transcriptional regulator, LuxR family n=1 Tax=Pseudoduganella namucuonensis TaxID=1035707 RepID=A0A1I7GUA9_9BURK|nr:response regulator [Pseudoduganella namucuonensis]SFU52020.1 two component transcriptional regulator, LuxR family [Pseudoduganella namucuonensis]